MLWFFTWYDATILFHSTDYYLWTHCGHRTILDLFNWEISPQACCPILGAYLIVKMMNSLYHWCRPNIIVPLITAKKVGWSTWTVTWTLTRTTLLTPPVFLKMFMLQNRPLQHSKKRNQESSQQKSSLLFRSKILCFEACLPNFNAAIDVELTNKAPMYTKRKRAEKIAGCSLGIHYSTLEWPYYNYHCF